MTMVSSSQTGVLDGTGGIYVAQSSTSNAFCNVDASGTKGTSFSTGLDTYSVAYEPGKIWACGFTTGIVKSFTPAGVDNGTIFTLPGGRHTRTVTRLSDLNKLVVSADDGTLWIYNETTTNLAQLGSYAGSNDIYCVFYRPGTNAIYVSNGVSNGTIQLVSLTDGSILGTLTLPSGALPGGVHWYNGHLYVVTGLSGQEIADYLNP